MIIKLNWGGKYEVKDDGSLVSLNYAEKGMFGCSKNRTIPDHLSVEIKSQYKKEEDYRTRRTQKKKKISLTKKNDKDLKKQIKSFEKTPKNKLSNKDIFKIKHGAIKLFPDN